MFRIQKKNSFLDAASQGRSDWWRYFSVILCITCYWGGGSGLVAWVSQAIATFIFRTSDIGLAAATFFPSTFVFLFLISALKISHKRPVRTLVNSDAYINWRRLFSGFGVWFLLLSVLTLSDAFISPESYLFTLDPIRWLSVLPTVLLLIPIQSSADLLYRGYLMQALSLISKKPLVLIVATSLAFSIPHFSDFEIGRGFIWVAMTYFAWGIFMAAITLKDNGLELALGVHAADNIFFSLFLTTPSSGHLLPTIWMYKSASTWEEAVVSITITALTFYFIFFGGLPRNSKV